MGGITSHLLGRSLYVPDYFTPDTEAVPVAPVQPPWEGSPALPVSGGRSMVPLPQPPPPAFDPMAGSTRKALADEAEEEAATAAQPARRGGLAAILSNLTPQQAAALMSRTVQVGGGGGSMSRHETVKTTPQLPGIQQTIGDLELQARTAELQRGEAQAEQAKQEALAHRGFQTVQLQRQTAFAAREKALQAQIDAQEARHAAARADVSAMKVDPDRWFASRTNAQRFALGVSAALSGFIQGFRGQAGPNPVIELANQQIDRDLAAQKANIAKKGAEAEGEYGILRDLYNRFGSMQQAEVQARMMMTEALGTKLKGIAATAQEPLARANALQAATAASQQYLTLRNIAWSLEHGERTTAKSASGGGGGQRVPLLQMLQQQALAGQQYETTMAKSRLEGEQAKRKLAGLDEPDAKPKLEGTPLDTINNALVARKTLARVAALGKDMFFGKREILGTVGWMSTWKSRLQKIVTPEAAAALSKVTGRSAADWQKGLLEKWDNWGDMQERLGDANNAISDRVGTLLDVQGAKYDTEHARTLEKRASFLFQKQLQAK